MIKVETKVIFGQTLLHTYSDAGKKIERDGRTYDDAYDPVGSGRIYTESSVPCETREAPDDLDESAAYLLENNLVELPAQQEPDYLNEREPESNYFA